MTWSVLPFVVPDIFADSYSQLFLPQSENSLALGRLEITGLVKNVVGRQERLVMHRRDLSVAQHGDRVVQRPTDRLLVPRGVTDDQVDPGGSRRDRLQGSSVVVNELRLKEQILWRIADDRQLRKDFVYNEQ